MPPSDAFVGHHRHVRRPNPDPIVKRAGPAAFVMADVPAFPPARQRRDGPAPNTFLLAPSLVQSLASGPVEEVLFLRDEMANLAWGIERVVESALSSSR